MREERKAKELPLVLWVLHPVPLSLPAPVAFAFNHPHLRLPPKACSGAAGATLPTGTGTEAEASGNLHPPTLRWGSASAPWCGSMEAISPAASQDKC